MKIISLEETSQFLSNGNLQVDDLDILVLPLNLRINLSSSLNQINRS